MSFSISSCVLLFSCLLVTISADSLYGDAKVFLFKDASARKQLNIFEGDHFLVEISLRGSDLDEYVDISRINVTQSVQGLSEDKNAKFVLEIYGLVSFSVILPLDLVEGTYLN
uniref:Uncharacterized protein n=1 Tax=Cacopsylla melanoneura TaxID=428564 RepID=A0A8D8RQU6_9HEMI